MTTKSFASQFTEVTSPSGDDYVLTSAGKVRARRLATPGGTLDAWNGTSNAQFATSQTLPAPSGMGGGGTNPELNIVTDAELPGGKAIELSADAFSAYGYHVWWRDLLCPLADVESISAFVYALPPTAGDSVMVGFAFAGDAGTENAIVAVTGDNGAGGQATYMSRVEPDSAGALIGSAATGGPGWLTIYLQASRPVSNPPALIARLEHVALDGTRTDFGVTTGTIDDIAAWTASWDTADCDRIGLVLFSGSTGAANPVSARITDLRIRRRTA